MFDFLKFFLDVLRVVSNTRKCIEAEERKQLGVALLLFTSRLRDVVDSGWSLLWAVKEMRAQAAKLETGTETDASWWDMALFTYERYLDDQAERLEALVTEYEACESYLRVLAPSATPMHKILGHKRATIDSLVEFFKKGRFPVFLEEVTPESMYLAYYYLDDEKRPRASKKPHVELRFTRDGDDAIEVDYGSIVAEIDTFLGDTRATARLEEMDAVYRACLKALSEKWDIPTLLVAPKTTEELKRRAMVSDRRKAPLS